MISFTKYNDYREEAEIYENHPFDDLNESNNQGIYDHYFQNFFNQPELEEDNHDYDNIYFHNDYVLNQQENKQLEKLKEIDNKKTKQTTIMSQVKEIKAQKNELLINKSEKETIETKLLKKKRGRKTKAIANLKDEKEVHSKYKEDNLMRKIRTHLFEFIVVLLNISLNDKTYIFHKIDKKVSENLKKDFNLSLNERTLLDIFQNEKMNGRYKNFSNKYLIEKLLKEQKEVETLKLLNLKFLEIYELIKNNYLQKYLDTIEQKEQKEQKENTLDNWSIDEYLQAIRTLFLGYEAWFKNKKGRKREKKVKQE